MADSDLSLLFKLRGDNAQLKSTIADTRAAVGTLKQSFGPELTQSVTIANKAFSQISDNLNLFVGQRIPLVGGAFVRVTENLRNIGAESNKSEKAIASVAKSIQSIATESGKTVPQITSFLTKFVQLEGQANRDKAAIDLFGATLGAKLIPQLEQTGAALTGVAEESAASGASIGAMAGPIGIAVLALAALAAGAVVAAKEIFDLAKTAAEFQGKLFDLSQQTGVSVETLAALEAEARKTGGSIETVAQSLGHFQSALSDALEDKGSKAAVTFHALGVEATDTESALRQTIAALARMPEGFEQTARARDLFGGRGAKAFLAIAKETNGDLDKINERLKELGGVTTEEARRADEFNDQLVDLDIQLRGLGTLAIPVVLDALKDLSKFLIENRQLFILMQGAISLFAQELLGPLQIGLALFEVELQKIATIYEKIRVAIEFIVGHPISNPFEGSTTPPTSDPFTEEAKKQAAAALRRADSFKQELRDRLASREKLQAVLNVDFAEQQAQARDAIAKSQRDLEAGKIDRAKALEQTIAATKKETQAQIDALEVDRRIKLEKAALAGDDLQKQQGFSNQILAIDAQLVEKRATLARTESDLRAKARLDDQKDELAHQQANLDTLTKLGNDRIAAIEDLINREKLEREVGLKEIEDIENAALQARGQLLKKELTLAGAGPDRQSVLDKIKALEADRTALERAQSQRRIQLTRDEFEQKRQILLSSIDTLLQLEQLSGNAQIARIQVLAGLRIKSEEQAAKEILAIRLRLLDDQIEATKAKERAASGIIDPRERRQTQTQLANDLKLLNAERLVILEDGEREIENQRQKDLENERRYADDLAEIKRRVNDIERDTADEVIRLMILHFARRKDIIRAQRNLDLADEAARHERATVSLNTQRREVDDQIRFIEQHLKSLKVGTTEEIEQYERLVIELEKLRIKRAELKAQQDAEDERSRTRQRRITDQGKAALEREEPLSTRSLFGDAFKESLEAFKQAAIDAGKPISDLNAAFKALAQSAADAFHQMSEDQGNFATFANEAFQSLAQGIGQIVESYVLLGETGPAALRKLLAQVLAHLAAESAVKAIFELAEGFAMLFINPAASAAHFTAAAIYGSVAGVAAVAGRSVAGDLFKSKGGGGSSGSSGTGGNGELNTLTLARNAGPGAPSQVAPQIQPIRVTVNVVPDGSKFGDAVTAHVVEDFNNAGPIREVTANDGNLNRG